MRAADLPEAKKLGKRFLAVLHTGAGRRTAVATGSEGWLPVADLLIECGVSFNEFCAAVEQGGRRFQLRQVDGQREIRSTPRAPEKVGRRLLAVLRHGEVRHTTVEAGSGGWLPVAYLLQVCRVSYDEFCAAVEQGGRRFQLRVVNGQHEIRSTPRRVPRAIHYSIWHMHSQVPARAG